MNVMHVEAKQGRADKDVTDLLVLLLSQGETILKQETASINIFVGRAPADLTGATRIRRQGERNIAGAYPGENAGQTCPAGRSRRQEGIAVGFVSAREWVWP